MLVTDHMTKKNPKPKQNRKAYKKLFLTTQFWTLLLPTISCKESLGSLETLVPCSVAGKKAKILLGRIKEKQ